VPAANTIALDIGGSTTDIAIWTKGVLEVQESVKMAAGAASRHVESLPAFQEWLVKKFLEEEPYKPRNILRPGYSPKEMKKRTFHAALKKLAEENLLDSFIKGVLAARGKPEVQSFLSPVIYLFSAVSYYAGLLTRKAIKQEAKSYYVFYCGKGGQLLRWIPSGEDVVKQMFAAGVVGPGSGDKTRTLPNIEPKVSKHPKMEVGRGILVEKNIALQVNHKAQPEDIYSEATATVTVAESGYGELKWDDNLKPEMLPYVLQHLPELDKLEEMNHFITTFNNSNLTAVVAKQLGISSHFPGTRYRDKLMQEYSNKIAEGLEKALIEPLFITETKVLLELITKTPDLFD
jgi:hypothetical protein